MSEAVFRCNICRDDKLFSAEEANEHKRKTGHNNFRMVKSGIRDISKHD